MNCRSMTTSLLIGLFMVLGGASGVWAQGAKGAATITVSADGKGDVKTLSDAIAKAQPGATIKVKAGEYPEAIVIDKKFNLTITGEKGVWLVTKSPSEVLITIKNSSKIQISHLSAKHVVEKGLCYTPVVYVHQSNDITVQNGYFEGSGTHGIAVERSQSVVLENNHVYESTQGGIRVAQSRKVTVKNNVIYRNVGWTSLRVYACQDVTVANNTIAHNSSLGLYIDSSQNVEVTSNVIAHNVNLKPSTSPHAGIFVERSDASTLKFSKNCVYKNAYKSTSKTFEENYAGIKKGSTDLTGDPKFKNAAKSDFAIASDSTCKGLGAQF